MDEAVRKRNRANKSRGLANETALEKALKQEGFTSARRVPGSGRYRGFKGDVEVLEASTLLEAKVYQSDVDVNGVRYVRIDLQWVSKAQAEAVDMGFKHSAVIVRPKGLQERVAVLSWVEYLKYLKYCSVGC